jgi:hypothetical protein
MKKKLLAVITRMYAERGGDRDEFVEAWGGSENGEFIIFPRDVRAFERAMLLIHGYDYPRVPSDASIARAGISVTSGLQSNSLVVPDCEVGLLFHPPLTWGATAKDRFAEGVLNSTGRVTFVREYRNASQLVKSLAPKCRTGRDFSSEFDKIWREYRANLSRYDSRFGLLLTQMDDCVTPLITRLDYWSESGFDPKQDENLVEFYVTSTNAIEKALGASGILTAVNRIVNTLILETRSKSKLELIEKKFQDLESFLSSKQGTYADMKDTLELFKSSNNDRAADVVKQLNDRLKLGNPIRVWYTELLGIMGALRLVLLQPDV